MELLKTGYNNGYNSSRLWRDEVIAQTVLRQLN